MLGLHIRCATSAIFVACCPAETIMFPEAPLALRLSGQLVLGVVRVYYRQLEFLDDDAAAAFTKLLKVAHATDQNPHWCHDGSH